MSAAVKPEAQTAVKHPARPAGKPRDIAASYAKYSKRFPKILAKLSE